jgi:hypothetical protein
MNRAPEQSIMVFRMKSTDAKLKCRKSDRDVRRARSRLIQRWIAALTPTSVADRPLKRLSRSVLGR